MSGAEFESREISVRDQEAQFHELEGEIVEQQDQSPDSPWSYVIKRGKKPISLTGVEWRILKLLASRPYHAFTPQHIAQAVTTENQPVTEDSLRDHISSLRDKLGFFADYVQTVPYIGYRFRE